MLNEFLDKISIEVKSQEQIDLLLDNRYFHKDDSMLDSKLIRSLLSNRNFFADAEAVI